jgi:site-specific DNA-methyltransferase (adenine-specific)
LLLHRLISNVGIEYDSWVDSLSKDSYFEWVRLWLVECYRVLKLDGRIAINVPFEVNMIKSNSGRVNMSAEYWKTMQMVGFQWFGFVRLKERSTQRVKFTAWGSWQSPSCPYIHNAEECVLLAYKESSKKINKGITDLTKEDFVELVSGEWEYRAETQGLTMANYSEDIPMKAIKLLTWQDDMILDPFSGSGTTGVAALKLNRNFIGFEISKQYYKIAYDRIQYEIDKKNCTLNSFISF